MEFILSSQIGANFFPAMDQLTDAQIALYLSMDLISGQKLVEYKLIFKQLNKNERGVITIKELGAMIKSLDKSPSEKELEDIFRASDVDGNGEIDFREFCFVMASFENEEEREMCQVFKMLDRDEDGFITQNDLLQLVEKGDSKKKVIRQIIRDYDFDRDGRLSFAEFLTMIKKIFSHPPEL
ncbi:calmodulin-beta-like [Drosophila rhopaloa]|uniref:Calmodulin-beta-like n=1 Tax=Drosophila rhopaloa TaxID=1041015 RepID=A0A6P4DVM3_DRORH|nr:calmodulin-beta-like [Drosophila rhopaloa]